MKVADLVTVTADLTETNKQLQRIADALESIISITNPLNQAVLSDFPEELNKQRIFYTDEEKDVADWHLAKMGKYRKE